jgi:hypothetical protein
MVGEQLTLFPAGNGMQVQKNAMAKKVAALVRRKVRPTQTRDDEPDVVVPDEKAFSVIFAGNAETARKNLDRFAPRI